MPNEHTWKETTEDGDKREVRATKFGGAWRIQAKLKGEESWMYYDVPRIEDLRELREVLFRKYQRRRATYEELGAVEKMIREREGREQ
jgi:hypothetical protein